MKPLIIAGVACFAVSVFVQTPASVSADLDTLVNAERAARRYWNVDGLAEIYAGCFFLLVPLLNFIWQHASIAPAWLAPDWLAPAACLARAARPDRSTAPGRLKLDALTRVYLAAPYAGRVAEHPRAELLRLSAQ